MLQAWPTAHNLYIIIEIRYRMRLPALHKLLTWNLIPLKSIFRFKYLIPGPIDMIQSANDLDIPFECDTSV